MNLQAAGFRTTAAWLRARRIRQAIDRYYRKNPDAAIAYINERLARASRLEEYRRQLKTA
jgi:hypothetical protein